MSRLAVGRCPTLKDGARRGGLRPAQPRRGVILQRGATPLETAARQYEMHRVRIEKVGDVNFTYPYLEVFINDATSPFLEIGISEKSELTFKFYPLDHVVLLNSNDWHQITTRANEFLPQAIKDEHDFSNFLRGEE